MNRSVVLLALLGHAIVSLGCSPAPEVLETTLPPVTRDAPQRVPELLVARIQAAEDGALQGVVIMTKDDSGLIIAGALDNIRLPKAMLTLYEADQCDVDGAPFSQVVVTSSPAGQWKHAERLAGRKLLAEFERASVRLTDSLGNPVSECAVLKAAAR